MCEVCMGGRLDGAQGSRLQLEVSLWVHAHGFGRSRSSEVIFVN